MHSLLGTVENGENILKLNRYDQNESFLSLNFIEDKS